MKVVSVSNSGLTLGSCVGFATGRGIIAKEMKESPNDIHTMTDINRKKLLHQRVLPLLIDRSHEIDRIRVHLSASVIWISSSVFKECDKVKAELELQANRKEKETKMFQDLTSTDFDTIVGILIDQSMIETCPPQERSRVINTLTRIGFTLSWNPLTFPKKETVFRFSDIADMSHIVVSWFQNNPKEVDRFVRSGTHEKILGLMRPFFRNTKLHELVPDLNIEIYGVNSGNKFIGQEHCDIRISFEYYDE